MFVSVIQYVYHSIVSAWVLIPLLENHNPAIFCVPQLLKNLTSSPDRQKAPIIPIRDTCLTITHILISEQSTNAS